VPASCRRPCVTGSAASQLPNLSVIIVCTPLCSPAGTIPPLLALLVNSDKSIPIAAVCVLSSLSDGGLSCEQLLQVRAALHYFFPVSTGMQASMQSHIFLTPQWVPATHSAAMLPRGLPQLAALAAMLSRLLKGLASCQPCFEQAGKESRLMRSCLKLVFKQPHARGCWKPHECPGICIYLFGNLAQSLACLLLAGTC